MLIFNSILAFLFCAFFVFYYERSKRDYSLFIPALLMLGFLVFLQFGGYLSVLADIKLISILVGVLFAFLYVQLRWKLRVLLKN